MVFLAILAWPVISGADGSIPGWNRFVYLIYKLEVTNYCRLTTDEAGKGYQLERRKIIDQYRFSEDLVASAQAEAWKLAYREWDNRGLGGFRRWCRNDGQQYLGYLEGNYAASLESSSKNN